MVLIVQLFIEYQIIIHGPQGPIGLRSLFALAQLATQPRDSSAPITSWLGGVQKCQLYLTDVTFAIRVHMRPPQEEDSTGSSLHSRWKEKREATELINTLPTLEQRTNPTSHSPPVKRQGQNLTDRLENLHGKGLISDCYQNSGRIWSPTQQYRGDFEGLHFSISPSAIKAIHMVIFRLRQMDTYSQSP